MDQIWIIIHSTTMSTRKQCKCSLKSSCTVSVILLSVSRSKGSRDQLGKHGKPVIASKTFCLSQDREEAEKGSRCEVGGKYPF